MKKIAATIFFLSYFLASSGATIQSHYCMDKLVSWTFSAKSNSHCGSCGMDKKGHKGCCHDENKTIKLGKEYKASFTSYNLSKLHTPFFKNITAPTAYLNVFRCALSFSKINAPPLVKSIPVYLSISVFRI